MTPATPAARSYLFVPGSRPERFAKALATEADVVVLDLEDAVALADKSSARTAIAGCLAAASPAERARLAVRINHAASAWFADDLQALAGVGLQQLMLPKAESPEQVARVRAALPEAAVLALIESARGVAQVEAIASAVGVQRLAFGTLDFALDMDMDISQDATGLAHAASRIALASRVAGLPPPVAGVTAQFDDEARLAADMSQARAFGFGAKLCIHPRQVAGVHRALRPTPGALEHARRVLEAEAASPGAAQLDGRMIDLPVVLQAQRTLLLGER